MLRDAIILAGGFGTRLQAVSGELPKPLVKVGSKTFLDYVIEWLVGSGIERIILSLHHKPEMFFDYLAERPDAFTIIPVVEPTPLGTGGAIKYVLGTVDVDEPFCVINGDTYLEFDIHDMFQVFSNLESRAMVGLSHVSNAGRFGKVDFNNNKVVSFEEKSEREAGWVNNGCYMFCKDTFDSYDGKFSIENDMFPKLVAQKSLDIYVAKGAFLDIGIPEDYYKFKQKIEIAQGVKVLNGNRDIR